MASKVSLEELAYLKSGRFLTWVDQVVDATTINDALGAAGVSGVDVSDIQLVKLTVDPTDGKIDFNVQYEYEGKPKFHRIDYSERYDIDFPWTQEVNVSGVARIYVSVTRLEVGASYSISVGKATKE